MNSLYCKGINMLPNKKKLDLISSQEIIVFMQIKDTGFCLERQEWQIN